ncbi:MAG: M15 family metallopeptidase [Lachnospiraceae bacterium]|nr:M15 family metallopeptidase [Lachnospiraceae bacterium]
MNIPAAETNTSDRLQTENIPGIRITFAEGFYYEPLSEEIKEIISGKSFQENDIIDYSDLRQVTVRYIGFDDMEYEGMLIVNVQVADDVSAIFKDLYDARYPIEKIRLIDEYNADDEASMADNNTSAFCFRKIDGQETISDHSYGIAVDINPLYNPYVRSGFGERDVLPVNAGAYADRSAEFAHKIVSGDVCYNAFVSRGWKWGGEWDSPKDYQHFYKEIY